MILHCLLICLLLRAFSSQAKVMESFSQCSQFFYNDIEPQGIDQNATKICQKLQYDTFVYATLYSKRHRIPLYSAYTYNYGCGNREAKQSSWFIEPQLSGYQDEHMNRETEYNINTIKRNQAINTDYSNTGYDRGHLNPNSFQSGDDRKATFTLTNAVPMDACLNRVQWKQWETELKNAIKDLIQSELGTAYLVTGAVPDPNYRIPQRGEFDEEETREFERVTVPSHVWTALCYKDHNDDKMSFSLGILGLNQPDSNIQVMLIPDLNSQLTNLYGTPVRIFNDNCFSDNEKTETIKMTLYNKIQLPESQKLRFDLDMLTPELMFRKRKITEIIRIAYKLADVLFMEIIKISEHTTCFLIYGKAYRNRQYLTKRDLDQWSESFECLEIPEKFFAGFTAADGTPCKNIFYFEEGCIYCKTGSKRKPCCSSPCLYKQESDTYMCHSGQKLIQCSPQYSLITYKGEKCKNDHPCGKYGYKYYWCYKASGSWDYCSPPLFSIFI